MAAVDAAAAADAMARIAQLEYLVTQLQGLQQTTSDNSAQTFQNFNNLAGRLERLEVAVGSMPQTMPEKERSPMPMAARRAYNSLKQYDGKTTHFEHWKFQVEAFFGEELAYPAFLDWAEKLPSEADDQDLLNYAATSGVTMEQLRWMNHQLYHVLSLNCVGEALDKVKNMSEQKETRGINTWNKLVREHQGWSAQRMIGLIGRIFNPTRAKKYDETMALVEAWELKLKEYERNSKAGPMEDMAKVAVLRMIVPVELEKNLMAQNNLLTDYKAAKIYIVEKCAARKEAWFGKEKGGVQPMDLDHLNQQQEAREQDEEGCGECGYEYDENGELHALKGGNQKGAGKGKFNGVCWHCHQTGHRSNQCPVKE